MYFLKSSSLVRNWDEIKRNKYKRAEAHAHLVENVTIERISIAPRLVIDQGFYRLYDRRDQFYRSTAHDLTISRESLLFRLYHGLHVTFQFSISTKLLLVQTKPLAQPFTINLFHSCFALRMYGTYIYNHKFDSFSFNTSRYKRNLEKIKHINDVKNIYFALW